MRQSLRSITTAAVAVVTIGTFGLAGSGSAHADALPSRPTPSTSVPVSKPAPSSTATGSVSATLTSPVKISGTRAASVKCTISGKTYSVTTTKTGVNGYSVSTAMDIHNYTGPGAYSATASVAISGNGYSAAGAVPNIKVTISATDGTWNFSKSATGAYVPKLAGKTLIGSISYTCNV